MRSLVKLFSGLLIFSLVIKVFDVIKNLLIASKLGVSSDADIYLALISIPDSILIFVGLDTLRGVINSEYSSLFYKDQKNKIAFSFNSILNIVFVIVFFLLLIMLLFRESVISILLPGFSGEKMEVAVFVALFVFPVIMFRSYISLFQSFFYAFEKPFYSVVGPILITASVIFSLFLPYYEDKLLYNISIGFLLGNFLLVVIYFFFYLKFGGKFKLFQFKIDETSKIIFKSSFSILALVIFNQLFLLSKNFFASFYGEGAISSLNYSSSITSLIPGLIFTSIFSVLLAKLVGIFTTGTRAAAKKLFLGSMLGLVYFILPIIILFCVFGYEILSLIYLRGEFSVEAIQSTFKPFIWDSLAMFSFIMFIIPTAFYLAKKEYLLLTKIGITFFILGVILNYALSHFFGFWGIAVSNFIVTLLYGAFLLKFTRKFIGKLNIFFINILKLVGCSIVIFILSSILKYNFFSDTNGLAQLLFTIALNAVIIFGLYFVITYFFNVNYLNKISIFKNIKSDEN